MALIPALVRGAATTRDRRYDATDGPAVGRAAHTMVRPWQIVVRSRPNWPLPGSAPISRPMPARPSSSSPSAPPAASLSPGGLGGGGRRLGGTRLQLLDLFAGQVEASW